MSRVHSTLHSVALCAALLLSAAAALAGPPANLESRILPPPAAPASAQLPYIKVPSGRVALTHVRVIDGTGQPAQAERTIVIADGKITSVSPATAPLPSDVRVLDLSGYTVLPGIVGMHDHLFYIARPDLDAAGKSEPPLMVPEMAFSAPRLYLANGVTTIRTTGSVEPNTDLNLKQMIDAGKIPGPHMDVTGPYLEGPGSPFIQMHMLKDADDARRTVAFWADRGVTSFKAYMYINRAELKAAIAEAHRRGLKITGHLCAVTYREAAALGIDDLEHGFFVNTEDDPGKKPDSCTKSDGEDTLAAMDPNGARRNP